MVYVLVRRTPEVVFGERKDDQVCAQHVEHISPVG